MLLPEAGPTAPCRASSHHGHRPPYSAGSAFTRTDTGARLLPFRLHHHPSKPYGLSGDLDLTNCGNPLRAGSRDFLLADSASLRTALERRRTVVFGALQVHILSIEDLVILKIVAGRLRDRADSRKNPCASGRPTRRLDYCRWLGGGRILRSTVEDSVSDGASACQQWHTYFDQQEIVRSPNLLREGPERHL